MKQTTLVIVSVFLLTFAYIACRKYNDQVSIPDFKNQIITKAVNYVRDEISAGDFATLDLNSIYFVKIDSNTNSVLFISTKDKSENKFVVVEIKAGEFKGNWLVQTTNDINGTLKTRSFDDQIKNDVTFTGGKPIKIVEERYGKTAKIIVDYSQTNSLVNGAPLVKRIENGVQTSEGGGGGVTLPPVYITAYVTDFGFSSQLSSIYWSTGGGNPALTSLYTPISGGGGGSGNNTNNAYSSAAMRGPSRVQNLYDYLKCFTNVAGSTHTYKITVCVDQPIANSRSPWAFSKYGVASSSSGTNPVNVGHSFLLLTEVTSNGTVTRNIGFYPEENVTPVGPNSPGEMNNNEGYGGYDIAVTATLTNSQFFNMINYMQSNYSTGGTMYNLNTNNCTSFVIRCFSAAGINLPQTVGQWPGGSGLNPGDLAEDLRGMTLPTNMTRSTLPAAHPNTGNCGY